MADKDRLRRQNARLKAENLGLRTVVLAVEWVECVGGLGHFCPWCRNRKDVGHDGKCPRQVVLPS